MRFYDVPVNRSVPTESNSGLTSYTGAASLLCWASLTWAASQIRHVNRPCCCLVESRAQTTQHNSGLHIAVTATLIPGLLYMNVVLWGVRAWVLVSRGMIMLRGREGSIHRRKVRGHRTDERARDLSTVATQVWKPLILMNMAQHHTLGFWYSLLWMDLTWTSQTKVDWWRMGFDLTVK
jgi:hypothetical protein